MTEQQLIKIETTNLSNATEAVLKHLKNVKRKKLKINSSFFLSIHKEILAHEPEQAGKYRTALYSIEIPGGTVDTSPPWKIRNDIIDLIEFINNRKRWPSKYRKHFLNKLKDPNVPNQIKKIIYPLFIIWYIHHKIVKIHPFNDGNGRTARLVMCLIARDFGLIHSIPILINLIIKQNKKAYLDALNAADKGNYIKGVYYLAEIFDEAYKATLKIIEKDN
jgi:Fic family protein